MKARVACFAAAIVAAASSAIFLRRYAAILHLERIAERSHRSLSVAACGALDYH